MESCDIISVSPSGGFFFIFLGPAAAGPLLINEEGGV